MLENQKRSNRLSAVEARNALRAETFRKLPKEIDLWRFRDVLVKLGTELGLSGGAVVYALDLMGLLTEADWRGDGRAVTFHSLRAYARKVGKSERTICEYERQLIAAGLAHRTVKHARRHGGYGNEARRTGLDWRSFGVLMPELLERLDQRAIIEERRLDLEASIRTARRIVLGMIDGIIDRAGQGGDAFLEEYTSLDVARLRGTLSIPDLEHRLAHLHLLQERVEKVFLDQEATNSDQRPVDNIPIHAQHEDQSEDSGCLIDITDKSSCPSDIRNAAIPPSPNDDGVKPIVRLTRRSSFEMKPRSGKSEARSQMQRKAARNDQGIDDGFDTLPLKEIWKAAPVSWKTALGEDVEISWPVLIEVAQYFVPQLGVSPYAWNKALRILGPSEAALALMVLDRNRDHPLRPVMSVGGALVGMTRHAEQDNFNIAPSVYGIIARGVTETDPAGRRRM